MASVPHSEGDQGPGLLWLMLGTSSLRPNPISTHYAFPFPLQQKGEGKRQGGRGKGEGGRGGNGIGPKSFNVMSECCDEFYFCREVFKDQGLVSGSRLGYV